MFNVNEAFLTPRLCAAAWEDLCRQAVPHLSIGEEHRLKEELQVKEKEHASDWTRVRLENLELRERQREQERQVAQQAKVLEAILVQVQELEKLRAKEKSGHRE